MSAASLECPYQLLDLIGEGGMGQVYLARHKSLDRIEALKVLSPRLAKASDFVARLKREARAASMLTHPNIVAVFGIGRLEDGRYYLAMEHLRGETLEQIIDRDGPLSHSLSMRLLYQLASALAQAHSQSVVHRDIKPANMMVVDQASLVPNLKVLDFGLAKITSSNYVDSVTSSVAGHLFGTPGFMAPERIRGVSSVPTLDVYSFGCVAYNIVTGQAPFVGRPMDVLDSHQREMPPLPSQHRPVDGELETIIMRCLSKDPSQRPADGETLCRELEGVAEFSAQEARRRSAISSAELLANKATAETLRPEATAASQTLLDLGPGLALANTVDLTTIRARTQYRETLMALGKAVIESGCRDANLIMAFGGAHQSEISVQAHAKRLSSLFREGEALEQQFRVQESALRFELNELSFHASESEVYQDPQVAEARANDITEDLVRAEYKFERSLRSAMDAEVDQAAILENAEEALSRDYDALLRVLDGYLEEAVLTPALQLLLQEFQAANGVYQGTLRLSATRR